MLWGKSNPHGRGKSRHEGLGARKCLGSSRNKKELIAGRPKLCKQINTGKYAYTYVFVIIDIYRVG